MSVFDSENLNITVCCASGVEKVAKSEIKRLLGIEAPAVSGAISFSGSAADVAACNVNLRTADRVYIRIARFRAENFDELYDGVRAVRWQDVFTADARVTVNGRCRKSKLFAVSACQGVVKKAVADSMCAFYNISCMPENGAEYHIEFRIIGDEATILLDTSGVSLHKRGYRDRVGIAPIRETLAAALVLLSDYYWKKPFADPFCGSGTIAVEAALIAADIAPGMSRSFAFCDWKNFGKRHLKTARQAAADKIKRDRDLRIFASDIDSKAIKLAVRHAKNAGVSEYIDFAVKDVADFASGLTGGTIVTNPPYGERVYGREDAENCYKSLGKVFGKLNGWSLFAITGAPFFEKYFGKKADRNRKIYNSEKECRLYYYYADREIKE